MNPTLRTAEEEERYQEDVKNGKSEDITQIKPDGMINGLRVLNDRYPPDLLLEKVDNLIGEAGKDWEAYIRFGMLFFEGKLPYDGFWLNNLHRMSQPKAWHIKGAYFNEDNISFLRTCMTHREKIEFWLKDMGVEV